MPSIHVNVIGGAELAHRLNALPDAVSTPIIRRALLQGGGLIRDAVASRIKRGTDAPHAADHVGMTPGRSGRSLAIGPTKDYFYWLFQEFGTVHHPAQPALRPAFDATGAQAVTRIGFELWSALQAHATASQGATFPSTTSATFL